MLHERSAEEKASNMPELHKVKQMLPAGWGGAGMDQVQYMRTSMSLSCDDSISDMFSSPTVMRSRGANSPQSRMLEISGTGHYDIPAFLRRQVDSVPTIGAVGDRIIIKADRIWFMLNDAQATIFALLTPNPQAIGARIWFVNEKHEVFDYMDFISLEDAVNALQLNGFSDYVKKKFSRLNRVRTRYTWKCEDHTRVFTNSATWIKT